MPKDPNMPAEPGPIQVLWRLRRVSGREFECGIYRRHAWFDVRLVTDEDRVVYSQVASSIEGAREVAALWRATLLENGGFTEIDDV